MDALRDAMEVSFGSGDAQALVVKYLAHELPISEAPVLDVSD